MSTNLNMTASGRRTTGRTRLNISLAAITGLLAASMLSFTLQQVSTQGVEFSFYGLSNQPLSFEQNVGQTDQSVRFIAHAPDGTIFFTRTGVTLSLKADGASGEESTSANALRLEFVGATPASLSANGAQLAAKVNYFMGNDPANWHTNVPVYAGVTYSGLYDGVVLNYEGTQGQLKGIYTVAAGADASQIKWRYDGASKPELDSAGNLVIRGQGASALLTEQAPIAWQEVSGVNVPVTARYALAGDGTVSFALGAYDHTQPLIIDPTLAFSTYLGGSDMDEAYGIAVDSSGNIYVTGHTYSTDFPTVAPYQGTNLGAPDVFITRFNANGTVAYSTYLGGTGTDIGYGIAVDTAGNAYISGYTVSTNFPTQNAYQPAYVGGLEAFLTKLNAAGSALLYSTYFGGSLNELAWGVDADAVGNAYITGDTASSNYPTKNPYQATFGGGRDAFLARLDTTASGSASLIYSTYLGGSGDDYSGGNTPSTPGHGVATDGAGNAYLAGETTSTNFPTRNAYDPSSNGGVDAWVSKIDTDVVGDLSLIYSTYLGGSACCDYGRAVDVDASGNAYVTGQTNSGDFPTVNSFSPCSASLSSPFVTKLNVSGNALVYSTCFGASGQGNDVAVDGAGRAHVTGTTNSPTFPQVDSLQGYGGGGDGFALTVDAPGNTLAFSTFIGGSAFDRGVGVASDGGDKTYVSGSTLSTNFPLQNPYQPAYAGQTDAFVSVLDDAAPAATVTPTATNTPPPTATTTPTPVPTCLADWGQVVSADPPDNNGNKLVDVAAAAPDDVWAVGTTADYFAVTPTAVALVEHWNGSQWILADLPLTGGASIGGVAALPNDVWVVGDYEPSVGASHVPLLLHGDGSAWTIGQAPSITVPAGGIRDVAMLSSNDVWVAGSYVLSNTTQMLALHWDGSLWAQINTPTLPDSNSLQGIAVVSANDIWAVGEVNNSAPLFLHWDGSAWSVFNNPAVVSGILYRVSAVSANDVWAVGYLTDGSGLPLVMHYDGSSWSVVNTPLLCCNHELTDVAALSANDVWAVSDSAFIHWDGTGWNLVSGDNPPPDTTYFLQGIGAIAPDDIWAVGSQHVTQPSAFDGTLTEHYSLACPAATATPVPGASSTPTAVATNYVVIPATGTIVPGVDDVGNHCDECVTTINLPFPATLYDQQFSTAILGSNGMVGFVGNANPQGNTCVPDEFAANFAIYAYWDDLYTSCTDCGIFTSVSGSAPNRIFNIEWRAARMSGGGVNFEVRLYEEAGRFDLIYGAIASGGSQSVGVQRDSGSLFTRVLCKLTEGRPEVGAGRDLGLPEGWILEDGVVLHFGDTPECPLQFTDVPQDSTFYPYIHCLSCRGIINGYADGSFKPGNQVSRGQLSKIVSSAAGFSDPQNTQLFEDVGLLSTFQTYIGRLAARGYINGYPCGGAGEPCGPANLPYFRPGNNATRGQISKIVSNAAGFTEPPGGQTFEDVEPGSTFYDFIERLVSRGVMQGYPCGGAGEPCGPGSMPYFRPNSNASRGQTSKIVSNAFFPECQP